MGWLTDKIEKRLQDVGAGLVNYGYAAGNASEGAFKTALGQGMATSGTISYIPEVVGGNIVGGAVGELQDISGIHVISDETLNSLGEGSVSGWLRHEGTDLSESGVYDLGIAGGHVVTGFGQIVLGEGALSDVGVAITENLTDRQDGQDNQVTQDVAEVINPIGLSKWNFLIRVLEKMIFSDDLLQQAGIPDATIRSLNKNEYHDVVQKVKTAVEKQASKPVINPVDDVKGELMSGDVKVAGMTMARVLAGPDGWTAVGQNDRQFTALRAAQSGDFRTVEREWTAWRAAGGVWRND